MMHRIDLDGPSPSGADAGSAAAQVTIRPISPEDLDAVWELERQSFSSPWSREAIERHALQNPSTRYLVAELAGEVVGYVGAWVAADEGHIVTLAVSEGYRRRGIASRLLVELLLDVCERGARYVVLEYRPTNEAAAQLYSRFGFRVVSVRRGYYRDTGEDAIVAVLRDLDPVELQRIAARLRGSTGVTNST
jgi:ribosomal-protein-alanine N-acetyltransferase